MPSNNSSPARSQQGANLTPRKLRNRRTQSENTSVGSPARSDRSGRLPSIIDDSKKNRGSFVLSPLSNQKSILTDNTFIDKPGRLSWWKKLGDNSRDVIEVLNSNEAVDPNNVIEEYVDVLSQEKKNYTLDLPESSDNESINSIVVPQRRLFTQQSTQNKNNYDKIIGNRDTLAKINKTNNDLHDKSVKVTTKNLFNQAPKRARPAFPEALLTISPNKSTANKTKEMVTADIKGQVRTLFGTRPGTKRKNMFVDLPENSDNESINSIVVPQRRLFTQQSTQNKNNYDKIISNRDTLAKINKTNNDLHDKSAKVTTKNLFNQAPKRARPAFPEALLTISPNKSTANKTKEMVTADIKGQVRTLFGTRPGTKRKNMFVDFIVSESEDEIPTSSINTDIEMDDWKLLPSSTMVDNQIDEMMAATTPVKKARLSKLSKDKESENGTNVTANKTKHTNKSLISNNSNIIKNTSATEVNKLAVTTKSKQPCILETSTIVENEMDDMIVDTEPVQKVRPSRLSVKEEVNTSKNAIANKTVINKSRTSQTKLNISHVENDTVTIINKSTAVAHISEDKHSQERNKVLEQNSEVEQNQITGDTEQVKFDHSIKQKISHNGDVHSNVDNEQNESKQSIEENKQSEHEQSNEEENEQSEHDHSLEEEYEQSEYEKSIEEENEQDGDDHSIADDNEQNEEVEQDSTINELEDPEEQKNESSSEEEVNETGDNDASMEQLEENEETSAHESEGNETDNDQVEQNNTGYNEQYESENENSISKHVTVNEDENPSLEQIEVSASTSNHDTTGQHRNKKYFAKSPEAILQNMSNKEQSFTMKGRNTSIRKTKSKNSIKQLSIKPSLAPVRDSTGFSDGTKNSSAEGSGWDSHRTTRQTMGKDFTPRKSLRALVMEKSAKRYTVMSELNDDQIRVPQANSTQYAEPMAINEDEENHSPDSPISNHEVSKRTKQAPLKMLLQSLKRKNLEQRLRNIEEVKKSLQNPSNENVNFFKMPSKPGFTLKHKANSKGQQNKAKSKVIKSTIIPLEDLPAEMLEDMKYKPPKRYGPRDASWITKRLYKFIESKLEPKYDYKARVRAEKLVETIYTFTKDLRRHPVAPKDATEMLKREMARLNIVQTHFQFYNFFHDYMPREVRVKVVPDIVNKIPLPKHGVFVDILT